jgi:hypothetical protein
MALHSFTRILTGARDLLAEAWASPRPSVRPSCRPRGA